MEAHRGNFLYDEVLPKAEFIYWLVTCLGITVRVCLLRPKGDTLLMIGLGGLAIVYFLHAFNPTTYAATDEDALDYTPDTVVTDESFVTVLIRYLQSFGSGLAFCGILFKLLFWKGSTIVLPFSVLLLLPVIAWQSSTGSLRRQTVLVIGLGVFAWAIPADDLARQLFRDDPALAEQMVVHQQHPRDQAVTEETNRLLSVWRKRKQ